MQMQLHQLYYLPQHTQLSVLDNDLSILRNLTDFAGFLIIQACCAIMLKIYNYFVVLLDLNIEQNIEQKIKREQKIIILYLHCKKYYSILYMF